MNYLALKISPRERLRWLLCVCVSLRPAVTGSRRQCDWRSSSERANACLAPRKLARAKVHSSKWPACVGGARRAEQKRREEKKTKQSKTTLFAFAFALSFAELAPSFALPNRALAKQFAIHLEQATSVFSAPPVAASSLGAVPATNCLLELN